MSHTSTSAKLLTGTWKLNAVSSKVVWSAIALARVGASLVLATTMSNTSDTAAFAPSVAVTFTLSVPTSALTGVPLKVRVAASKASQEGSAAPSAVVAA